MPKYNIFKKIASISLLMVFFATIVSRDFYHLLGHKQEVTCSEHNNSAAHFHALDKCNICDHNFSAGAEGTIFLISSDNFIFLSFESLFKDQYSLNRFFQNPDSRGSPASV